MPENLKERNLDVFKVPIGDRIPFGDNKVGRIIHDWHTLTLHRALEIKCRENMEAGLTRLLLALKCYKIDNGELPDSLDELVPEYIDKIPIDDFDGKPLRYSKQKKIVYSVGSDLKDDGGPSLAELKKWDRPGAFLHNADDPAVKIDF